MGRKKITNLFPDYIRTGKADLEVLSQLVLSAKGERSMNDFANECGVNTSTISRIINMKNTTACSDEVLVAISKAADPNSGVTLDKLLAANGMVKLVPAGTEGAVVSDCFWIGGYSRRAEYGARSQFVRYVSEECSEDAYRIYVRAKLQGNAAKRIPYEWLFCRTGFL